MRPFSFAAFFKQTLEPSLVFYYFLFLLSIAYFIDSSINPISGQQFVYLAQSFLHGHLYFLEEPGSMGDVVMHNGKMFWALGPFPAILMIPFIYVASLFGIYFYQGLVNFGLILAVMWMIGRLCNKIGYSDMDALYLLTAYIFASPQIITLIDTQSWFFANTIVVFFTFLAYYGFVVKQWRPLLIGIIYGCIFLTRSSAGLGIMYYVLMYINNRHKTSMFKNILHLLIPVAIAAILLGSYNYARFGSFTEQGYSGQITGWSDETNRAIGVLSIRHIPEHLYSTFLKAPFPLYRNGIPPVLKPPFISSDYRGMGLFYYAPYLLSLFTFWPLLPSSVFMLVASGFILLPLMMFFGNGARYYLDFFPFLFLIFITEYYRKHGHLSAGMKILIILSTVFTLYCHAGSFNQG